jgi:hypothetical protein
MDEIEQSGWQRLEREELDRAEAELREQESSSVKYRIVFSHFSMYLSLGLYQIVYDK